MSCEEESEQLAGKNILATDPDVAATLNATSLPADPQLIAAAKVFVENHHESSAIINKFIDECAIKNGVMPADCKVTKEVTRCASPNIDMHFVSPSTDFNLSIAVFPEGFGGPAKDAIQDNLSQGPGQ